jgi:hypothetical protein
MDREEDLRLVPKKVEAGVLPSWLYAHHEVPEFLTEVKHSVGHAAIRYRMRSHAMKQCESAADAYVQCTRERTFSIAWACRDVFRALKECTSH